LPPVAVREGLTELVEDTSIRSPPELSRLLLDVLGADVFSEY
jgi:hypothetical protein